MKTYWTKSRDIRFWSSRKRCLRKLFDSSSVQTFPKTPNQNQKGGLVYVFGGFWLESKKNTSLRIPCVVFRENHHFHREFGRIKALNPLPTKQKAPLGEEYWNWFHSSGLYIYMHVFSQQPKKIYMYIFFIHIHTRRFSQTSTLWKRFRIFFPFSQKQLFRKKKACDHRSMNCQPFPRAYLKMWKDSRKSAAKILSPFTCLMVGCFSWKKTDHVKPTSQNRLAFKPDLSMEVCM